MPPDQYPIPPGSVSLFDFFLDNWNPGYYNRDNKYLRRGSDEGTVYDGSYLAVA